MATPNYGWNVINPTSKINIPQDVNSIVNQIDTSLHNEMQTAYTGINGKAPTNHASTNTTYGVASETNYGHTKLYDSLGNNTDGAVTQKVVSGIKSALSNPYNSSMVAVGDSNVTASHISDSGFQKYISQIFGSTFKTYAKNGATMGSGIGSYDSIQELITSAPTDANVSYCFIMGGINDFHYGDGNVNTFKADCKKVCDLAHTKWPNATIVLMMDSGSQYPNQLMFKFIQAMYSNFYGYPLICIPLSDMCLNSDNWSNQNHYSDNGYKKVASRIANQLLGSYTLDTESAASATVTPNNALRLYNKTVINPTSLYMINQYLIYCDFTQNVNISAGTTLATFWGMMQGTTTYMGIPIARTPGTIVGSYIIKIDNVAGSTGQLASKGPQFTITNPYDFNSETALSAQGRGMAVWSGFTSANDFA